MYPENIGKYIAKKRKEKKTTQKEFAERLGVTDKTVSRWENGHYLPDITLLQDIAVILDVTISELLNGEDGKKENVDDSITKIVEVSKHNIHESKRNLILKSILIILIIIIIISCISIYCIKRNKTRNQDPVFNISSDYGTTTESSIGFTESEDGWVCHFTLEHEKNIDEIYYSYGCDNYKYEELDNFYMSAENYNEYLVKFNHPTTLMNDDYQKESRIISEFFTKHKFTTEISLEDLKDLKVELFNKEDILVTFNRAVSSNKISSTGNYYHFPETNYLLISNKIDNKQYYVGYYLNQGHIAYISIELKIKNEYLSDKVKNNTATKEEIELYNFIDETEKYILNSQIFWHKDHFESEDKDKRLLDLVFYKLNNPEEMSKEELVWMERIPNKSN